jgi:uncharacterized membrane protein YcaP (DUF421 family)
MNVDWGQVFSFDTPVLEIIVRGTITYLSIYLLLRLILKRVTGTVSVSDLLVLVLVADAAQNAMAGTYNSLPDGLVLVGTIIFWSFALDWIGYHFQVIGNYIHPGPLELIRNGRLIRRNMAKEFITYEELMSQLRKQGLEAISQVKHAYLEGTGEISVISMESEQHSDNAKMKAF